MLRLNAFFLLGFICVLGFFMVKLWCLSGEVMRKTVCLIGRPNTGKSTLFNRLINEKKAIIDDMPGVTRDRLYGICNYKDKSFHLIDTGGIDLAKEDFNDTIKVQA